MPPLCVLKVEGVGHVHDQHPQDNQEEGQPRQEEVSFPSSDTMTCQTVNKSRHRGEHPKETTEHDHPVPVLKLVGEGHGDQSNPRNQIAYVKEKEASEERVSGS